MTEELNDRNPESGAEQEKRKSGIFMDSTWKDSELYELVARKLDDVIKADPQIGTIVLDMSGFPTLEMETKKVLFAAVDLLNKSQVKLECINVGNNSDTQETVRRLMAHQDREKIDQQQTNEDTSDIHREYKHFPVAMKHLMIRGSLEQDFDRYLSAYPDSQYWNLDMREFSKEWSDKEKEIFDEALKNLRAKGIKYNFANWRDDLKKDFQLWKVRKK